MDTPRRKRFEKREPETTIRLTERDLFVLEALHIHGPLSSSYLRAFARHVCKDNIGNSRRFATLTDHGYLSRPLWQTGTGHPRIFDQNTLIIYDLTDKAIRALKEAGRWSEFAPNSTKHDIHKFMTACITAAAHLGALDAGIVLHPPARDPRPRGRYLKRYAVTVTFPRNLLRP